MPRPEPQRDVNLAADCDKSFFSLGWLAQHFGQHPDTIRALMKAGGIPVALEINSVSHVDGHGLIAIGKALRK